MNWCLQNAYSVVIGCMGYSLFMLCWYYKSDHRSLPFLPWCCSYDLIGPSGIWLLVDCWYCENACSCYFYECICECRIWSGRDSFSSVSPLPIPHFHSVSLLQDKLMTSGSESTRSWLFRNKKHRKTSVAASLVWFAFSRAWYRWLCALVMLLIATAVL